MDDFIFQTTSQMQGLTVGEDLNGGPSLESAEHMRVNALASAMPPDSMGAGGNDGHLCALGPQEDCTEPLLAQNASSHLPTTGICLFSPTAETTSPVLNPRVRPSARLCQKPSKGWTQTKSVETDKDSLSRVSVNELLDGRQALSLFPPRKSTP